jgi:hypothetical protein
VHHAKFGGAIVQLVLPDVRDEPAEGSRTVRHPVAERDPAGCQPASYALAPFPAHDAVMAEHAPSRLEILEDLVGVMEVRRPSTAHDPARVTPVLIS